MGPIDLDKREPWLDAAEIKVWVDTRAVNRSILTNKPYATMFFFDVDPNRYSESEGFFQIEPIFQRPHIETRPPTDHTWEALEDYYQRRQADLAAEQRQSVLKGYNFTATKYAELGQQFGFKHLELYGLEEVLDVLDRVRTEQERVRPLTSSLRRRSLRRSRVV